MERTSLNNAEAGGLNDATKPTLPRRFFAFSSKPTQDSDDIEVPSNVSRQPTTPGSIFQSLTTDTIDTTGTLSPKGANQTVTIEHTYKKKKSGTVKKLTKPIIALIGAIVIATTGSAAFFFSEFLSIPGLKTQITRLEEQNTLLESQVDELETQVNRLSGQVDILGVEVDQLANQTETLAELNDDLELNVANLTQQNEILNSSLHLYEELNLDLNQTVSALGTQVDSIRAEVLEYSNQNRNLNQTVTSLDERINVLDQINFDVSEANTKLWNTIETLSNETAELSQNNEILNSTIINLKDEVSSMSVEIGRLDQLSANLATVISFFNEAALNLGESFDQFSLELSTQVAAYRVLVLRNMEILDRQQASFWDCDFREYFLLSAFIKDRDTPLGEASYPEVLDYVENRILSEMCLNTTNFEVFLAREYVGSPQVSSVTFNQLQQAVGLYTDLAVAHYYPGAAQSDDGVDTSVWAAAEYKCINLPSSEQYQYPVS